MRYEELEIPTGNSPRGHGRHGCTTAYYGSAGSGFDDLYATHDRVAIANQQKAEAEARQAEAEARKAEWEAMLAEAEAKAADKNTRRERTARPSRM